MIRRTRLPFKRAKVDPLPSTVPDPGVVPAAHWWTSRRRGPHTRKHYALQWDLLPGSAGSSVPNEQDYALHTVCHKQLPRSVNGVTDAKVLNLPTCERCLSSGPPSASYSEPPWPPRA